MMKQAIHPKKSLIKIALFALLLFGSAAHVLLTQTPASAAPSSAVEALADPDTTSCNAPDQAQAARCQELEAAILAATVRLEIEVWAPKAGGGYEYVDGSIGHATVMAGRFLVTHNHFSLSLEDLNDGRLRKLSAYRADGRAILQDAPFHTFDVLVAGPETLVFDFGRYGRQGALAYVGLASAQFADWQALDLEPGTEVAQVNWDGQRSFVDWVRVSSIGLENGTPVVELDNYPESGASGGGVFYRGYHLGNNWFRGRDRQAETGEVLRQFSVGALNEAGLIALSEADPGDDQAAASQTPETGASSPAIESADVFAQ